LTSADLGEVAIHEELTTEAQRHRGNTKVSDEFFLANPAVKPLIGELYFPSFLSMPLCLCG
jgi:hypothetical protein